VVDVAHDLRPRQVEQVRVAGDVERVVAEALAAVLLLAADALLDQHAPGAVEDGDALREDGFESFPRVVHLRSLPQARWLEAPPAKPPAPGR
jgi:hypothetical protein